MKKSIILYILILASFLFFIKCFEKRENDNAIRILNFDVSPNCDYIVFSLKKNGKSSIYRCDIDGKDVKLLFSSESNISFYKPRFSNNGKDLVFLGEIASVGTKNSIWSGRIDASGLTQLIDSTGLRGEAVYGLDDSIIYYSQAEDYAAYSPIGMKAPHNFNIYQMNLLDRKKVKLTNINAYTLYNIIDFDKERFLLTVRGGDEGLFFLTKKQEDKLDKIITTNDTLNNSTGYSNAVVLDKNNIICSSYYKLIVLNLLTKNERMILPSTGSHFKEIRYCNKGKKVFFTKNDNTNDLYCLNINDLDLTKIKIDI